MTIDRAAYANPKPHQWDESGVKWSGDGVMATWLHHRARLRVCAMSEGFFVTHYDIMELIEKGFRVGPFDTLEDAMLAAEMMGEIATEEGSP